MSGVGQYRVLCCEYKLAFTVRRKFAVAGYSMEYCAVGVAMTG